MPNRIAHEEEERRLRELEYQMEYHPMIIESDEDQLPKKRGPKKKPLTPSRVARFKVRRIKANGRERQRMKGLNEQLEVLRETIPPFSFAQKLSKIETLRLAKNYIEALSQMITHNQILDNYQFGQILCQGLSSNTINLIATTLSINPNHFLSLCNDDDVEQFNSSYEIDSFFY